MQNKTLSILRVASAVTAVALILFAPLATQVSKGLILTVENGITLFDGFDSPFCSVITSLLGAALVLFVIINEFGSKPGKFSGATRVFAILFLIMQIVIHVIIASNFYDDSTLSGLIRTETGSSSIHPAAIIAAIFSLATVVLTFMSSEKKAE